MTLNTDTTTMKSPAESAAAGATWLDENYMVKDDVPWFCVIDLAMFDMDNGRYCVIGQLYGPYVDVILDVVRQVDPTSDGSFAAAMSVSAAYGWIWPEIIIDGYWDYPATESWKTDLNDAWRDEIERRRS